jgi:hypothetical protein
MNNKTKKNIKNKLTKTIKNVKYKNGIYIYPKEIQFKNTEESIMKAAKLLNESLNEEIISPKKFLKEFKKNMNIYFKIKNPNLQDEYSELLKTNKSNGYKLKWNVFFIKPNYQFKPHIHKTIEYAYGVFNPLYEYRYKYPLNTTNYKIIRDLPKKDLLFHKNNPVINPINSLHHSFTKNAYSVFLILWCKKHFNLSKKHSPKYIK